MVLPSIWLSPWLPRLPGFTRANGFVGFGFGLFGFTFAIEARGSRRRRRGNLEPSTLPPSPLPPPPRMKGLGS